MPNPGGSRDYGMPRYLTQPRSPTRIFSPGKVIGDIDELEVVVETPPTVLPTSVPRPTPSTSVDWPKFYKNNYKDILSNKEYSELRFRINHEETVVSLDRFHQDYFKYLKKLASSYKTTLQSYAQFSKNDLLISDETFKDFRVYLAMLVWKYSKTVNNRMAKDSCAGYEQNLKLVDDCHNELSQCNENLDTYLQKRFERKVHCDADTFNVTKVNAFYKDDREYLKLLDLAQNGVDFEVDPDFIPNNIGEPIRQLQKSLQKVYDFHVDKLVTKNRAVILDLRRLSEEQKKKLNFCSLHLVPKPSTDELPIDPDSNDRKGRLCFDLSNRHDGKLALNGGKCKELNIRKYGDITNPFAVTIVLRWVHWKLKHKYRWNQCVLCRQDVDAAFNRLTVNPKKAALMTALLNENHAVTHDAGNFGQTSLPAAYGIISRATKRLIEKNPNFKGVLSVVCDDYIFLTLKEDHVKADEVVIDVVERCTLGKGAIGLEKKLLGQTVGVYGFMVNLTNGTIRPMNKGIEKLTVTFWLFDSNQRQHQKVWQCLASLCEYYSHALRGTRPLVRIFEEMSTTCNSFPDKMAKATPLAHAIIELWRIITMILFVDKEAYNISLEDFCRSYQHLLTFSNEKWMAIEHLEAKPQLRIAITSDAGPHFIGATIHEVNLLSGQLTLLAYTTVHVPFDDPNNRYQGLREYLGLLVSLLLIQTYKLKRNLQTTKTDVEWYGDNTGALSWADTNKAKSRVAQCANLLVTWFPIVTNMNLSFTQHISGDEMIKRGVDALSRPEEGAVHTFDLRLMMDIQQSIEDSGILSLCSPHINTSTIQDVHTLFQDINSAIESFFHVQ